MTERKKKELYMHITRQRRKNIVNKAECGQEKN